MRAAIFSSGIQSRHETINGTTSYTSTFDPLSGTIVRGTRRINSNELKTLVDGIWIGSDLLEFSQVPETIDIKITDRCGFGCDYCYMSSTPKGGHAEVSLMDTVFDTYGVPYQVALGGGEPCLHPELPSMLKACVDRGVVPNLTTAGHVRTPAVVDAIRDNCGGIALTYHTFKGFKYFSEAFGFWYDALLLSDGTEVQLNVHLVAKKGCSKHLIELQTLARSLRTRITVVLLGYHSVGRGRDDQHMHIDEYMVELPKAISDCMDLDIAYSEALIPFAISRADSSDTALTTPMEGRFTMYADMQGNGFISSFDTKHPFHEIANSGASRTDILRERLSTLYFGPDYASRYDNTCRTCVVRNKCRATTFESFMMCAIREDNVRWMKKNNSDFP